MAERSAHAPPAAGETERPSRVAPLPARAAAILLPLGGLLMTASVPIDPPPRGPEPRGTIVAYTAAPERMDIAATILHNGFLFFGIGLLLAGFAVGRRGRWLAVIGGLAGGIGLLNLSGAVLSDWFDAAAGRAVGIDAAVRISESGALPVVTAGWFVPMAIGAALGPILLIAGLARGRVAPWWALAIPVLILALLVAGWPEGPLGVGVAFALATLLGAVLAVKLWERRARRARPPSPAPDHTSPGASALLVRAHRGERPLWRATRRAVRIGARPRLSHALAADAPSRRDLPGPSARGRRRATVKLLTVTSRIRLGYRLPLRARAGGEVGGAAAIRGRSLSSGQRSLLRSSQVHVGRCETIFSLAARRETMQQSSDVRDGVLRFYDRFSAGEAAEFARRSHSPKACR